MGNRAQKEKIREFSSAVETEKAINSKTFFLKYENGDGDT
jgi:hypothetical protein